MKKLVSLIAAIALIASACKKQSMEDYGDIRPSQDENQTSPNTNNNPVLAARDGLSIQYGMLSFDSFSDYTDAFDNIIADEEAWIAESNAMEFNSLLNNRENNESLYEQAGDDLLRSILNDKGCLKIGSYIIKFNPDDSLMYILFESIYGATATDLENLYDNDISENNITAIPAQESLISILQEYEGDLASVAFSGSLKDWWTNWYNDPENPNVGERCSEEGAKHREANGCADVDPPLNPEDNCEICMTMNYVRAGIYYSLIGKFRITNPDKTRRLELHKTPAYYKIKCGGWYGPVYSWNNIQGTDDNSDGPDGTTYKYRPYLNAVHPLTKYHFRCVIMAKFINDPNQPDPSVDREIRYNL